MAIINQISQANTFYFKPNMNGGNFIAQAYKHLKTQPNFNDSFDC